MSETKRCWACGETKPTSEFSRDSHRKDGYRGRCKACMKIEKRRYLGLNPAKSRLMARRHQLKVRYGMSESQYDSLLKQQGGACAICQKPETGRDGRTGEVKHLAVDHCHSTGRVRGLLCTGCNTLIGRLEKSGNIIDRVLSYIEYHMSLENVQQLTN